MASSAGLARVVLASLTCLVLLATATACAAGPGRAGSGRPGDTPAPPPSGGGLAYGVLPRPRSAWGAELVPGPASPAPPASPWPVEVRTELPLVPPALPVYRFHPPVGPPDGSISGGPVPPQPSAPYPVIGPAAAVERLRSASPGGEVGRLTVTNARLMYVAAVADGVGYEEPAYLFEVQRETAGSRQPVTMLVLAVAPSALR